VIKFKEERYEEILKYSGKKNEIILNFVKVAMSKKMSLCMDYNQARFQKNI
jgi:hypothetical protein